MAVLVWMFFGLGAAALVATLDKDARARDALVYAVVGALGAVAGGLAGRGVSASDAATPLTGATAAAIVGAVLALALVRLVSSGRRRATV